MAEALSFAGAGVAVTSRSLDDAQATAAETAAATSGETLGVEIEATDQASVEAAVATVVERFGGFDILINNAGILVRGAFGDLERAEFEKSLAVNVTGPWLACRAAGPHLWESGHGRVINVSSTFGRWPRPPHGLHILQGRHRAADQGTGHGVGAVGSERQRYRPGPFLTEKNVAHQHSEHRVRVIGQEVALRPCGKMHEIAGAAIYLASEASSYVTGSVLTVDGGWTAH